MTSGFHLAATQICNALRISHINFENLSQPTEMFCNDCQKNYMRITAKPLQEMSASPRSNTTSGSTSQCGAPS